MERRSKKILIVEPGGGLGNRLLTISSAYNLARECGITNIRLLWRNNNEYGCDFEDVLAELPFSTKVKTIHFGKESYKGLLKKGRFGAILYKFFQMFFYRIFRAWSSKVQLPTYQDMPLEESNALKDKALFGNGRYVYVEAYYQFYGELDLSGISFNKEIVDKYEDFKRKIGLYDAMHIRRTDNVEAIKKVQRSCFMTRLMK